MGACHQISSQSFDSNSLSVGKATGYIEISIKDEEGTSVPLGVNGRISIKGPQVMKGYLHPDSSINQGYFSKDGYFYTGDLGYIMPNNELVLDGREKEMIICGGEKVNPLEVESLIKALVPNIKDVVVFDSPDHILGEVPHAAIVCANPSTGSSETVLDLIKEALDGKVSAFKIPTK